MKNIEPTEIPSLFKTDDGTFLFNNQPRDVSEYKRRRKMFEDKEQEMTLLKNKINKVETEMSDIKDMLRTIIQKVS